MKVIGLCLIAVGGIWAIIAFNMDTTVTTESQTFGAGVYAIHTDSMTVNNLGLMDKRRNNLMFSGLTIIAGILLFGFGSLEESKGAAADDELTCPACKAKVPVGATKCMHCASEIPAKLQPASEPSDQEKDDAQATLQTDSRQREPIATGQANEAHGLSSTHTLLLLGLAVVVLLSVILGSRFWIPSGKRSLNVQNYADRLSDTSTTPTTVGYPAQDDPKAKKVLRSCVNGQAYAWENGEWVVFSIAGTPMRCHVEN